MRIVPNKILTVLALAFTSLTFANDPPPPPTGGGGLIPPDGLPIDNGLVFLFAAAIAFGLYKMYQFKLNKKAPM